MKIFSEGALAASNEEVSQQFVVSVEVGGSMVRGDEERHVTVPFPANTWVAHGQGPRVLLPGLTLLPQDTPPMLREFRDKELSALQVCPYFSPFCCGFFGVFLSFLGHSFEPYFSVCNLFIKLQSGSVRLPQSR
jgi:hypothetical protein